ncbi:hypothetical protein PGB90_009832 [Kerria lacca]
MKKKVILLMCGSFNPVTNMHLRMMEIARDQLQHYGFIVKAGFFSPVHDKYPKDTLTSITHRVAMLKLALETSDWLQVSTWESEQTSWIPTYNVLNHHQERINDLMNSKNMKVSSQNNVNNINHNPNQCDIIVKLICGGDFLSSFSIPNLWDPSHINQILEKHGLVVVTRSGYNISDIIEDNDILYKHMANIMVVNEFIENTISSTKIRKACLRHRSIKYLVHDKVEKYIQAHNLYSSKKYKYENNIKDSIRITANLFNEFKPNSSIINKKSVDNFKNNSKNKLSSKKKKVKEIGRVSRRLQNLKRGHNKSPQP